MAEIIYVTDYEQQEGYVVFGFKKLGIVRGAVVKSISPQDGIKESTSMKLLRMIAMDIKAFMQS